MGLDNYADKQKTTHSKVGSVYHAPKPNGVSKCRTVKVDGQCNSADGRSKAANRTRFGNDILGADIKRVLKRGY